MKTIKSEGTTKSERYLARLADHTFLNLWAYPNVYRDVIVNGKKVGKELCDLLVVCGDDVIIFSDKSIKWPEHADVKVAWPRWYKNAVKKSVDQVRGAERWITLHPDRIFLDKACTVPLPLKIPPKESRRVYSVLVALGAHEACSRFFDGDSGSFMIFPGIKGDAHMDSSHSDFFPFSIGDVDPTGSFVNVMNDITLDIIMRELDTITDFTEYLQKKASFIRAGNLGNAAGEEELLHYYLTHLVDEESHGFVHPENRPWTPLDKLALDKGHYESFTKNPQYIKKKEADANSYIWDQLIEAFTTHMLNGTTTVPDDKHFEIADNELGVRYMAMEPRMIRRLHGEAIRGLLEASNMQDRAMRAMLPHPDKPRDHTGYVIMTLALPKKELPGGYKQYRQARVNMLEGYCLGILEKNRYIKRIIGIAMEPLSSIDDELGSSEDMMMIEQFASWTPNDLKMVEDLCEHFGILKTDNIKPIYHGVEEYPTKTADYSFKAKPKNIRYPIPNIRIPDATPRNAKCPCGSLRKYKNCHGKD